MRVAGLFGMWAALVISCARLGCAEPSAPWSVLPGHVQGCYYILVDPQLYPRQRLPHFALYPPVYYSLPVPRPYGHSPFAYPPGYLTPKPAPVAPSPVTILNPFVPGKTHQSSELPASRTVQRPVRILNPFVATSKDSAVLPTTAAAPSP